MSMLPNVMILTGSIEVNKQDVVLVKAVYFILGKNQLMKKVFFFTIIVYIVLTKSEGFFLLLFENGGMKNSVKSSKLSLSFFNSPH